MPQIFQYGILFSLATLISRVTGLIRDVLLAHKFGAGVEFDSYVIAISFPFLLRRAFAEGAMTSAFVPLYNDRGKSNEFASAVITSIGIVTISLTVFVEIYPKIVPILLSSGASQEVRLLTSSLSRFSMPFVVFIFLWAVLYAIQNSHNKFFIPALSPMLMNFGVILGTLMSDLFEPAVLGPTIGFTVGGALMFVSLIPGARKSGFRYKPTFKGTGDFLRLFFPALLAMTVSEFNVLIDINVASLLGPGGVSAMQYANRFYQLPFGVFGVAMATVVLPVISNEMQNSKKYTSESIKLSLFLTVPSAVGLMALSERLISLVYQHGAFTYEDTIKTSAVLFYYSIGLPFYSIMAVLSRVCHAKKDMRTPFIATVISFIVNSVLDFVLGLTMNIIGIALATSLAGLCGMIYLAFRIKPTIDWKHIAKILVASSAMGIIIMIISLFGSSHMLTLLLVLLGMVIYVIFCKLLNLPELNEFFRLIRK